MIILFLLCTTFSIVCMEQPRLKRQSPEVLNAYYAPITETIIELQSDAKYLDLNQIALSSAATNYIAGIAGGGIEFNLYLASLENKKFSKVLTMPVCASDTTFTKNDSVVAVANLNRTIYLYNVNNHTKAELELWSSYYCSKLEPHAQQDTMLFAGHDNGEITLWDINQQKQVAEYSFDYVTNHLVNYQTNYLTVHEDIGDSIRDIKYNPSNELIAFKTKNNVYVWDVRTQKGNQLCQKPDNYFGNLSWNPTNAYELAIPNDKNVEIIDIRTKKIVESISCHDFFIRGLSFITPSLLLIQNDSRNVIYNRKTQTYSQWEYNGGASSYNHISHRQLFIRGFDKNHIVYAYIYDFSQLAEQNNLPKLEVEKKDVANVLPQPKQKFISEERECPICLEEYNKTTFIKAFLPCIHSMCLSCKNGLRSKVCPLCLAPFN